MTFTHPLVACTIRFSRSYSTSGVGLPLRLRLCLPRSRPQRCTLGVWSIFTGFQIGITKRPSLYSSAIADKGEQEYLTEMPKAAFYAVAAGRRPGVYDTWAEAEQQVKGYPAAKFKKFKTEAEALRYIASNAGPSARALPPTPLLHASFPSKSVESKTSSGDVAPSSKIRETSPLAHAAQGDLPSEYAEMGRKGWKFSRRTPHALVVYTDGSGLSNGQRGARAGLGVWWGDKGDAASFNLSERVPGELQTNNRGELLSVIRALETCPFPDLPLEIRTDSQYTIKCMTVYLHSWLRNGFKTSSSFNGKFTGMSGKKGDVKNADMIKHLLVLLRRREPKAMVRFKYVPGHAGVEGNEGADRLARMGAAMSPLPDRDDWLDPDRKAGTPAEARPSKVDVEIDESWLMTPDELEQFERGFEEDV